MPSDSLEPGSDMSIGRVEMLVGEAARVRLLESRFRSAWTELHQAAPHATGFQSPAFVQSWYQAYRTTFEPVVLCESSGDDELRALWLLAYDRTRRELVHAGAHQAEYHVWLARDGETPAFLEQAWAKLVHGLRFHALRFKYLPATELADLLQQLPGLRPCTSVRLHSRPLAKLDAADVRASFAKKSNKSRFNRLRKLGALEFRRLDDPEDLERLLNDFIPWYDFRQGAAHASTPFRDDARKRSFCTTLFRAAPDETHVTVTTAGGRPVAAHWGTLTRGTLHSGMIAYSPALADLSPGKLHLMQLSERLLQEGRDTFDLTPGGDPWKERFANAHDQVAELLLYRSALSRGRAATAEQLLSRAKSGAAAVGVQPSDVRGALARVRRATPSALVRKVGRWAHAQRELRIYRGERELAARFCRDARFAVNSAADLLLFEPGESWQSRDAFLSSALARLENGESVYTVRIDGRLAHFGWIVRHQKTSFFTEVQQSIALPDGSVALYDYYTHPDFRGRGLYRANIGHMMHEAFHDEATRYAYIAVLADNTPSRSVIESMSFEYQGSLHWQCGLGRIVKWPDAAFTPHETRSRA